MAASPGWHSGMIPAGTNTTWTHRLLLPLTFSTGWTVWETLQATPLLPANEERRLHRGLRSLGRGGPAPR
jgi:hypothetical protein